MRVQFVSCPEWLHTSVFLTHVFTDFSVDHKKVVHHFVVRGTVHEAIWTHSFARIIFHVLQQMRSVYVAICRKCLETHTTGTANMQCCIWIRRNYICSFNATAFMRCCIQIPFEFICSFNATPFIRCCIWIVLNFGFNFNATPNMGCCIWIHLEFICNFNATI